ncbi:MFS transporter, partial [Rhizobium leguminosarum]|uniref:MFS transporter n=1 Tax=Rhizobium leguminosarum TaxID=384 RepID=UPI00315D565C
MTAAERRTDGALAGVGLLDRERIIARPGFNRWLVPPAALAIHLCIGMAYGFSVFWLPLSKSLGITASTACPDLTLASALFTTTCDWRVADLGWIYTLFLVLLGSSAAIWGGWLERAGPRKAGVVSACCWCGGIILAAIGVITHQLWMMWLGAGVIGGIGLGLGYISPVSTLIKWFPDRRDVTEAETDAADDAGTEPHHPELMSDDADGGKNDAAAPAASGNDARLARTGPLEPAAPDGGGRTKQNEKQRIDPAEVGNAPVASRGEQRRGECQIGAGRRGRDPE